MKIKSKKISALILAGFITIGSFGITPTIVNATSTSNSVTRVATKKQTGTTTASTKMRSKSSTKGKVLATLKKGTKVEIIKKESNGWYKIKYKTKTGYVSGKYLKVTTTNSSSTTTKTQTGTTTANIKLRSSSSTKGKVLMTLKKGTKVEILKKESNGWYKVKYKTKTGYISGAYVKLTNTTSTPTPEQQSGMSFSTFASKLSSLGFDGGGNYWEDGSLMGKVRVSDDRASFALHQNSANFNNAIKNSLNMLLPTGGNKVYSIVSSPFSNQTLNLDGRKVVLKQFAEGAIIDIYNK